MIIVLKPGATRQETEAVLRKVEEAGLKVKGMLAIFSYGFDLSVQRFKDRNLALHTLSNYDYLISQASDTGYVNPDQLETLQSWRKNPQEWNP